MVAELPGPMRIVAAEEVTEGQPELRVSLAAVGIDALRAAVAAQPAPDWGLPRPAAVEAPKRRQTGEAPLVVVIDPGHGGIDPGAEAPGLSEAEVILTFARGLKEVLTRAGIEVVLTREEDVFVPLETRVSVARAAGADIFLSLHADALAEGEAVGATVYTLAEEASDAASELLAERHDRADLLAGVDLEGHDDQVAGVLMDLARTETAPRSERLAEALAGAIGGAGIRMHRHPHQRAAFSVLKSPDIPSVLLELGFLSSDADRARLTDPAWRELMAQAILAAIKDWALADAAEARRLRR
jgi:N-acetylmuramoyl-L-alanine amidase